MNLSDAQVKDLARPLVVIIGAFYQNHENEKGFQEWLKTQNEKDLTKTNS